VSVAAFVKNVLLVRRPKVECFAAALADAGISAEATVTFRDPERIIAMRGALWLSQTTTIMGAIQVTTFPR